MKYINAKTVFSYLKYNIAKLGDFHFFNKKGTVG